MTPDDFKPQTVRHFIYAAQSPNRSFFYAILTTYAETDPINAVGQVWAFVPQLDGEIPRETILNTNDGLACLWGSPDGSAWVGSVWGRMWTTANVPWDSSQIAGLQFNQTDPNGAWKVIEVPRNANGGRYNLAAICGSSDVDVHVGTFEGSILHWNGAKWSVRFSENQESIVRMHGTSASNMWAVGRNGLVLHFDGHYWHRVPLPGDAGRGETLTGVWANSDQEVYICSTSGAVFQGNQHGLTRLGEFPHAFYGIVEFGGEMFLAGGDHGVCVLRGNQVTVVKDNFGATGVYALQGRLGVVEPIQEEPRLIVHEPASPDPWTALFG